MDNLETAQIPGTSVLANQLWVYQYDEDETAELMESILEHFNSETSNAELEAEEEEEETSNSTSNEVSNESLNSVSNSTSNSVSNSYSY